MGGCGWSFKVAHEPSDVSKILYLLGCLLRIGETDADSHFPPIAPWFCSLVPTGGAGIMILSCFLTCMDIVLMVC